MVESGSINLESANISIGINNYIGADIGVQINYGMLPDGSDYVIISLQGWIKEGRPWWLEVKWKLSKIFQLFGFDKFTVVVAAS